jgi:hypothetical protein
MTILKIHIATINTRIHVGFKTKMGDHHHHPHHPKKKTKRPRGHFAHLSHIG